MVAKQTGLKPACGVSRAHLTCDPGDKGRGFNCVVAVIEYTEVLDGTIFQEMFLSGMIKPSSDTVLTHRMEFVGNSMYWAPMGAHWDARAHIKITSLSDSASFSLEDEISRFMSAGLDLSRPCWEIEYVEALRCPTSEDVRSVCILKYHHSLADGFTMVQQMISQMVTVDEGKKSVLEIIPKKRALRRDSETRSLLYPVTAALSVLSSLGRLLFMRRDPPGIYRSKTHRSTEETVHVNMSDFGGISVNMLKELAATQNVSVNDILLTVLSMSLRSFYLMKSSNNTSGIKDLTSVIWVSLARSFSPCPEPDKWDNADLGFAYCKLPLSESDPHSSLNLVRKRMHALKQSVEPYVINKALWVIGKLPLWLGKFVAPLTADCASLSISNIAGPTEPVYWPTRSAGIVKSIHFATSPPFRYGLLVSMMSYNDRIYVTLSARESVLGRKELEDIGSKYIKESFEALKVSLGK